MTINDLATQIGGTHYSHLDYQHWDFACDHYVHPMIYAATKYLVRFERKGAPRQDLMKTISYLAKFEQNRDKALFSDFKGTEDDRTLDLARMLNNGDTTCTPSQRLARDIIHALLSTRCPDSYCIHLAIEGVEKIMEKLTD